MSERIKIRKLVDQVDELCNARNILKRDIADKMGNSASYLSQILMRGGTSAGQVEQIAKALDLDPFYFDIYHVLTLRDRLEEGNEFVSLVVAMLIEGQNMNPKKRRDLMGKLAA